MSHDTNNANYIDILKDVLDNKDGYFVNSLISESINKKKKYNCIFKTILFFTNNRDINKNKTLKNLVDAIKGKDVSLKVFVTTEVQFEKNGNKLKISDKEENIIIENESNIDTLCFARLSVQNNENAYELINILQKRGIFVINMVEEAEVACDKYATACLLKENNIPQPNFGLLTKDILENDKLYNNILNSIYPEGEKNREYVIKILDGHGGTGVFLCDDNNILSILQAVFCITPDIKLLIQRKEEADGGDIRCHVLTLKNTQTILGSMKRVKLKGDFRSNVSLGSSAEPIKLTKEQEEIALKVAKISGMTWCAVDIMPLKKNSNKKLGDNCVLEYNSSPGTEGISDVLKENFMSILLDSLKDPSEFILEEVKCSYKEHIYITLEENKEPIKLTVKLDTGNGSKASTLGVHDSNIKDNKITFSLNNKKYTFDIIGESTPIVGTNRLHRYTILIPKIKIGTRELSNIEMAIEDTREKSTDVLLNRNDISSLSYVISSDKNSTFLLD